MSPLFRDILAGVLLMIGIAAFVVVAHYTPEPSDLEHRVAERMEAMP